MVDALTLVLADDALRGMRKDHELERAERVRRASERSRARRVQIARARRAVLAAATSRAS